MGGPRPGFTDTAPDAPASDRTAAAPGPGPGHAPRAGGFLRELPVLVLVALALALLIKTFLVQAFSIPSGSMEPTLHPGDRVLVNRLAYRFGEPARGDVVVFLDPRPGAEGERGPVEALLRWLSDGIGVTRPEHEDFIKRVIALPGETWEIAGGVVYVDGVPLAEPYLGPLEDTRSFGPETVPAGMLFVLGDNRLNSSDSRFGLGYVPIDRVVGKAFVIVWPPSRLGWIR